MEQKRKFILISNQVRFGYGFYYEDDKIIYFAFHGVPSRNDDFFTNVEITEEEFDKISREYPKQIDANRKEAKIFRDKYVEVHRVILEGWTRLL